MPEAGLFENKDIETIWSKFMELQVVRAESRKHQDLFDDKCEEIKQLLEEKYQLYKSCLTNTKCNATKQSHNNVRRTVQPKLCQMLDTWLSNKADEIQ